MGWQGFEENEKKEERENELSPNLDITCWYSWPITQLIRT